jgi:hypothetical protein
LTNDQLLLLFFGLPLAILGMGLRRALGSQGFLLMLLAATVAAAYCVLVETGLRHLGHGLPLPGEAARGLVRGFGPFALGTALIGALGGVMVRFRGHGSWSDQVPPAEPEDEEKP